MRYFAVLALCALALGCSGQKDQSQIADDSQIEIVKHPNLEIPEPAFVEVTLAQSREAYEKADALFKTKENLSFNALISQAGVVYIHAHMSTAIACTDRQHWPAGPGLAIPECIWELPYANDWVGCMSLQYPAPDVVAAFGYSDDVPVMLWLDRHYDEVIAKPQGPEFLRQLYGMEKLGAECESIVRPKPGELRL